MTKILKRTLIFVILGMLIGFMAFHLFKYNTKKHSPETTFTHVLGQNDITITYGRPFKKNRKIFGALVPFDQVWRTGANEATTFTTKQTLLIDGSKLPAGTYTLWTIPNPKSWKIIFNAKTYWWGVHWDGTPARDPKFDTLTLEVPVQLLPESIAQFSIYFEDTSTLSYLYLTWDTTAVTIPMKNAPSDTD